MQPMFTRLRRAIALAILCAAMRAGDARAGLQGPRAINSDAAGDLQSDSMVAAKCGANGTWVAVWGGPGSNRLDPLGSDAGSQNNLNDDIFFARSTDGGRTWSPKTVLKTTNDVGDDLEPILATDGQGRWMVVWRSMDPVNGKYGYDADILMSFSNDDGRTWSAPAPVNTDAASDPGGLGSANGPVAFDYCPIIVTDSQGIWVCSWTRADNRKGYWEAAAAVAVSSDNGAHWTAPRLLQTRSYGEMYSLASGCPATDGQGRWIIPWHSRTSASADFDMYYSISTDHAVSWSAPARFNAGGAADSGDDMGGTVATDRLGHWIAAWTTTNPLGGGDTADSDVVYATSNDNGATWSAPAPINNDALTDGAASDQLYDLIYDGAGGWVAAWVTDKMGGDLDVCYATRPVRLGPWTALRPLNPWAGTDSAKDGRVHLGAGLGGRWMAVWESAYDPASATTQDFDVLAALFDPALGIIDVLSPLGGGTFPGDSILSIQWSSDLLVAGTVVWFELWRGERRIQYLDWDYSATGEGIKRVYLPLQEAGSDYRIKAVSLWSARYYDFSDGTFTITGGAVKVHSPNGGQTWRSGTREGIWWQTNPKVSGTAVRLELWRGGKKAVTLGTDWHPLGEAQKVVLVPVLTPASDYKLRAVSLWNPALWDESDGAIKVVGWNGR